MQEHSICSSALASDKYLYTLSIKQDKSIFSTSHFAVCCVPQRHSCCSSTSRSAQALGCFSILDRLEDLHCPCVKDARATTETHAHAHTQSHVSESRWMRINLCCFTSDKSRRAADKHTLTHTNEDTCTHTYAPPQHHTNLSRELHWLFNSFLQHSALLFLSPSAGVSCWARF